MFSFDSHSPRLLVPVLTGLLLFLVMPVALADKPAPGGRTAKMGVRLRDAGPVVVGELWLGLTGLSAEAGVRRGESDAPTGGFVPEGSTTTNTETSILLGAAAYRALARGKHTQLSAGLRYRYERTHLTRDDSDATDKTISTTNEVSVPIRIEAWLAKRVSLYIEFGMALRFEKSVRNRENVVPGETTVRSNEVGVFGDPLGNAGVNFFS